MKRPLIVILSVLLLVLMFVACNTDGVSKEKYETVSVSLNTGNESSSKSLTSSFPQFDEDEYYWTYTAQKTDSGNTVGQTTSETKVKATGKGLGALAGSFSVGKWTFTVNAYLDQTHTKKVFTGSKDVKLSQANEAVTIGVSPLSTGKGTLAIKKMNAKTIVDANAVQTVSVKKVGDNSTEYWTTTTSFSTTYINQELDCGSYIVTVTLKDTNSNTEALEPIAVTIYKNLTTTLDGNVDDCYYTVTFNKNGATEGSVKPVNVKYGDKISTPTDVLTKTNLIFGGWFKDTSCTDAWDFNTAVTTDTELYAKWAKKTKGTASISGATGRTSCGWVQLWEGGPKWAEFNVGATIDDYSQATQTFNSTDIQKKTDPLYCLANVGGLYCWGGSNERRSGGGDDTCTSATDDIQGSTYDTAKNLWGSNWVMPTKSQFTSLTDSSVTTWTWCDGSNKPYTTGCTLKGYKVSGQGDYANSSIFLPAAGEYYSNAVSSPDSCNEYWTSTPRNTDNAFRLNANSSWYMAGEANHPRFHALSVRAILAEN